MNKLYRQFKWHPIAKAFWRKDFDEALETYDEQLFSIVSTNDLLKIFDHQGYWSGVQYNFYYHEYTGFEARPRTFGRN